MCMTCLTCPLCRCAPDPTGWIDLTSLVTGNHGKKSPYDDLAESIGK